MKKGLYILMCFFLLLIFCGCNTVENNDEVNENKINNQEDTSDELRNIQNRIGDIVSEKKDYKNFAACYVDYSANKVVVKLIDNSESEQDWFRKNIFDSEYLKFEQGALYTTSESVLELVENENSETIKFNKYLEHDNRIIYFASNIKELYVSLGSKVTLKFYITTTYQTMDDSIKSITGHLQKVAILRDGGSTIYKSNNLTMIVCNNLSGNKDIYVGNHSMNYEEFMCKNNAKKR